MDDERDFAATLRRSFPHLDDEQRVALAELLALALAVRDLRRWRTDAQPFIRTEAILRAGADVLRALIVSRRLDAPS